MLARSSLAGSVDLFWQQTLRFWFGLVVVPPSFIPNGIVRMMFSLLLLCFV